MELNFKNLFCFFISIFITLISPAISIKSFVRVNVPKIETSTATQATTLELTSPPTTTPFTTISISISTLKSTQSVTTETTKGTTSTTAAPTMNTTLKSLQNSTLIKESNQTNSSTITNATAIDAVKINRNQFPNYFCKCDLLINDCDINCCCDIDCTKEMIRVMDCSYDIEDLDRFDYDGRENGLPSCAVSSSIFCVLEKDDEQIHVSIFYC